MGEFAGQDIRAWFVASDFKRIFATVPLKPTATIGLDWASGDGPNGGTIGTFHQLYPLGHAHVGLTDVLGRQNLIESRASVGIPVVANLSVLVSGHLFNRASLSDGVYTVAGGVLEASSASASRRVGQELDITGSLRINRHSRVDFGYGRFAPGPFLTDRPIGARSTDWGFLSTSFTF